jgi:alkanesulfonate monooxygenase SsuD/methylene tetrahydromethanopterin reductase-like flavin-dependent oxidoreductase (luciferase family)
VDRPGAASAEGTKADFPRTATAESYFFCYSPRRCPLNGSEERDEEKSLGRCRQCQVSAPNPLLLGALLAGTTNRIRIGSGGVSLTYRNALQVAEDARLIEFMMPGRFDLGITRGLLGEGPAADASRRPK